MSERVWRVTFTTRAGVEGYSDWTTEATALDVARRHAELNRSVRVWTRVLPEWEPVMQSRFPGRPSPVSEEGEQR